MDNEIGPIFFSLNFKYLLLQTNNDQNRFYFKNTIELYKSINSFLEQPKL